MTRKSYTPEQIIGMRREAEVALIAWQANVRYGSLTDLSACPKNGLLSGAKRTKINGLQNFRL